MTENIDASVCLTCENCKRLEFGRQNQEETPPHILPTPLFTSLKNVWLQPKRLSQGVDRADRNYYGGRRQEKVENHWFRSIVTERPG